MRRFGHAIGVDGKVICCFFIVESSQISYDFLVPHFPCLLVQVLRHYFLKIVSVLLQVVRDLGSSLNYLVELFAIYFVLLVFINIEEIK